MKNKNFLNTELELIEKLLSTVNSKEEFNYLLAEQARLSSLFSQQNLVLHQLNKLMEI